jgi:general secretion pathway protein L
MKPTFPKRLAPLQTRLLGRWRDSQAQHIWRAWMNELQSLLPAAARARLLPQVRERLVDWPLSRLLDERHDERLILVLPSSMILVQTLLLPTAAVRDLHTVIGFELDKYTPYPRDQLHYVTRVTGKEGALAQVLLVAVLRERLQPALDECKTRGLMLHAVDGRDPQGRLLGVDLLPAEQKPPRRGRARLSRYLALACGALLVSCMVLWLDARSAMVEAMQQRVDEQRGQVQALQNLRRELINTQGAARYLAQQKWAQPTLSSVLVDLTGCLGADTWVEQLEIADGGGVSLSGQSAKASALITRMKDCKTLSNAQFQGIIQPDVQSGKERFSLRAQLRKEAADAP